MAGRYKSGKYPSKAGTLYNDRANAPIDAPCDDNIDTMAPTDGAVPTEDTPKQRNRKGGDDEVRGPEGEDTTRERSSSESIRRLPPEYLSRRHGSSPITERTRAALLSRVSPVRLLEHIAKGRKMLTTWIDPKSGETKDIWVYPPPELRFAAAREALDRVAPRLRAIEVSGETAQHYRLTIDDMRGLLAQADPVTRELVEAEYEEMIGETPDNGPSRGSGEEPTARGS